MTAQGVRQARREAFQPTTPARILSDEAMQYADQVAPLQAAAAQDPVYNGADAARRLRGTE
jgi:hypothetical protein